MKIAIFTYYLNDDKVGKANYGGVLQAYALQHYLDLCSHEAVQIKYRDSIGKCSISKTELFKLKCREIGFPGAVIRAVFTLLSKVKRKAHNTVMHWLEKVFGIDKLIAIRRECVIRFNEEITKHSEKTYGAKDLDKINGFDVYIAGSDQLWHYLNRYSSLDPGYFLTFVKRPAKKISYAASMAMPVIPDWAKEKVFKALEGFEAISVREKSDKDNLEKIMQGKPIEWVLDPTLLLKAEDWNSIAANNKYAERKYIFTYILGDNKKQRKCVERFAKENGLEIVNIPYLLNHYRSCDRRFGDIRISSVSPELWISLIRDAEYIFTDSFHGSVFSIHYHKKFYTFKRNSDNNELSMNSRVYSLFSLFDIQDRLISADMSPEEISAIPDIDYDKVEEILARERKHSSDFLLNAINS